LTDNFYVTAPELIYDAPVEMAVGPPLTLALQGVWSEDMTQGGEILPAGQTQCYDAEWRMWVAVYLNAILSQLAFQDAYVVPNTVTGIYGGPGFVSLNT
jgi:hypothetical protein